MLLKGKPAADKIRAEIQAAVEECRAAGKAPPSLALLRAGRRPDDMAYESRILKNCGKLGIQADVTELDEAVNTEGVLQALDVLNNNEKVHGILVFRPLPKGVDEKAVREKISPKKDIDCMSPVNLEKIFEGGQKVIPPCTPEAVIAILEHYGYSLTGKNVVIVNRSMVLGKPLSMLFLGRNATVTLCHSKTRQLQDITAAADIVVSGVGRASYFGPEYFSAHSVVVDVGINVDNDNKLCGDVNFEEVSERVEALTPVPGGVGTLTSMLLLEHVIRAMRNQREAAGG